MKKLLMICLTFMALNVEAKKEKPQHCGGNKPSYCCVGNNSSCPENAGVLLGGEGDGYAGILDGPISPAPTYVINLTLVLAEISVDYAERTFPEEFRGPGDMVAFGTRPGHRLRSVSAVIVSTGEKVTHLTNSLAGGFFAVQRRTTGEYYIQEYTGRTNRFTAYLVNVAGFPVSSYTIFHRFCGDTHSINPIPDLQADVRSLGSCAVLDVQARIATPTGISETAKHRSGPDEGVYVITSATSGVRRYEVVGPFRFRTT